MADNPYGWWADNLPTVMSLVFILLILLIVMIIYELYVFSKRPPEKNIITEWQTSWSMELRTGAFRMGLVTLAFALMLFLEYLIYTNPQFTGQGLGNLLLVAMIFNIVIILGWVLMLGIPKNYAVMKDGVFSRGKFYPWRSIKEVSYSRFYHRIVLRMWNPFVGEIYMVSESPRKMAKKIEKHLDKATSLRKKVPAKRQDQVIKKAPVKSGPRKKKRGSKKKKSQKVKKKRGKLAKESKKKDKKIEEKQEGEETPMDKEEGEDEKDISQEEETDIEEGQDRAQQEKEKNEENEGEIQEEARQKKEENAGGEEDKEVKEGRTTKTEDKREDIEGEDEQDSGEKTGEGGEEENDSGGERESNNEVGDSEE